MAERPLLGTAARPLRVVVIGNSAVFLTVPPLEGRDEAIYAKWLPELLLDRGIVSNVVVHSRWHATVLEVLPRFEEWVRDELPDLVIVNLGIVDCQARVLPTWLLRNSMTWLPGQGGVARIYRSRVVPRIRPGIRGWQRFWADRVGPKASRVRPAVFERSMARLVKLCVGHANAQVLLLDIDDANDRLLHWMPGLQERIDRYNGILHRVAAAAPGGRATLMRTSRVVATDPEQLLPDGIHRSGQGHRVVAEALADEIARLGPVLGLAGDC